MGQTFKLAWRNMWRNWRRTVIALIAMVMGVILLLFFDGFIKGSDQAIFGNAVRLYGGNIQVHAIGFRDKAARLPLIPLADPNTVVQTVQAQPQVLAVGKRINTSGLITSRGNSAPVEITALEPEIEAPFSLQAQSISQGRFLNSSDGDSVVIGKGLADLLQVGVGDNVTVLGRSQNETMRQHVMTVVGIYDLHMPDAEKGTIFLPLTDAQTLYNLRGQVTEAAVYLKSVGSENQVVNTLQAALPNAEVDSWQALLPELRQTLDMKSAFTSVFGIIVIAIASIGILNLMLMAVFERTREMGVLAALGMKGRQIMGLFLLEGSMIGLIGAVIGSVIGFLLITWVGGTGIDISQLSSGLGEISALMGTHLYPVTTLFDLVSRGVLVVIIAAIASLYPAWQASHKEPAEALHHV
jgi:ABC-type lipoprotein release transport system permease subunit